MSLGTVVVLLLIAGAVGAAVRSIAKGGSGCSGCSSCKGGQACCSCPLADKMADEMEKAAKR